MIRHTQKWFYNLVGKKVYRLPLTPFYGHKCECEMCLGNSVSVKDKQHAEYLKLCQDEEGIEYKKK